MKLVGPVALLALSLIVAGCASRSAPNPAATAPGSSGVSGAPAAKAEPKIEPLTTLAGTNWKVVELDGSPAPDPVEGWEAQSLEFDKDGLRVTGNGGVNRFGGRFTEDGKTLLFGPLALTRRLGPPAQMEAEELYTRVLSRVVEWRQEADKLALIGPGARRVALLEPVKPKAK